MASSGMFVPEVISSEPGSKPKPKPKSAAPVPMPAVEEALPPAPATTDALVGDDDIARIKAENEILKRVLRQFHAKYGRHGAASASSTSSTSASSAFAASAAATDLQVEGVDDSKAGPPPSTAAPSLEPYKLLAEALNSAEGTHDIFSRLQDHIASPSFLETLEKIEQITLVDSSDNVFVRNSDDETEVGFVDVCDLDWWTLVPKASAMEAFTEIESDSLDGAYVFVEQDDIVKAIAEFVALYISQIPATKGLSQVQLQKMLAGTFDELQEHGPVRKLWDWGQFLYVTYGWCQMGFNMYKEPETALLVLQGVFTASKWLLMCLALV